MDRLTWFLRRRWAGRNPFLACCEHRAARHQMRRQAFPILFGLVAIVMTNGAFAQRLEIGDSVPTIANVPSLEPGDIVRAFDAPNGRQVKIIVEHPSTQGKKPLTYIMRAIAANELPDCYFPEAVKLAVQAGATRLVIPNATYSFRHPASQHLFCPNGGPEITPGSAHLTLWNLHDLEIDGSGSTLNFNQPGYGVQVKVSQRLIVKGFYIDWPDLLIASHGKIAPPAGHDGNHRLVIDAKYPVNAGTVIQAVNIWDDRNNTWSGPQSGTEVYFMNENCGVSPDGIRGQNNCYTYQGGQVFSSKFFNQFPVGTSVLIRHHVYTGFAFDISSSNDIDVEDVHLFAGPGMGFVIDNGAPNWIARGFRFFRCSVDRGPGRLISTASDAFHASATQGDIILENSDLGYNGDDTLNIHGQLYPVLAAKGRTATVPVGMYSNEGDVFGFFRADSSTTLTTDYLGSAKVLSATVSGNNAEVSVDRSVEFASSMRACASIDLWIRKPKSAECKHARGHCFIRRKQRRAIGS
jgi:hypothetical protein